MNQQIYFTNSALLHYGASESSELSPILQQIKVNRYV
jgi:hypothetical protein